ncbi:type II secretion system protein GspL [Microbulbifer pacificus]|uniref:Type II secretion system protein GspL n=1 Tax=Microbulbifer pacificus TaxID=407164 RepID=A0AAU0MYH9_9GAMM|nr:type II secretion system protein GspL [Microbulbifer pacificus]WOX05573.1 type II secretion system protein GspL [Microbulbifer pacificus]
MSQELKLLRLWEPGAGAYAGDQELPAGSVLLQHWQPDGWHTVVTDSKFQRAFAADASGSMHSQEAGTALGTAEVAEETAFAGDDDMETASSASAETGLLAFEPGERAVLLLPGSWVWSGLETVPRAARRQSSALGYMVEDQLAEDVEDLHFVCDPVAGDLCCVMAVASAKLEILKQQIERLGWPVIAAIPEYRVLADGAGSSVWLERDKAHFWQGAGRGLTVSRPLAGIIAGSLFAGDDEEGDAEAGEGEASLRLYGDISELELATFQQLGSVEVAEAGPEAAWLKVQGAHILGNLLTGDYQISLKTDAGPWWKKPAIAAAACFVLQLVFFAGAGTYYKIQAGRADDAARSLFSEIFPGDSPGIDIRRQINGYLNQSSGGGGEFASQLQQLSAVWATGKQGELKLQSLRFDGNRGELVLQLRAANLGQLDAVVGKLNDGSQFKAELLAANELEDGVSGRIRLR